MFFARCSEPHTSAPQSVGGSLRWTFAIISSLNRCRAYLARLLPYRTNTARRPRQHLLCREHPRRCLPTPPPSRIGRSTTSPTLAWRRRPMIRRYGPTNLTIKTGYSSLPTRMHIRGMIRPLVFRPLPPRSIPNTTPTNSRQPRLTRRMRPTPPHSRPNRRTCLRSNLTKR